MADRMADALTLDQPARRAAVDVLAPDLDPPTSTEPADALSDLLAVEPAVGLTAEDMAEVALLDNLKVIRGQHERKAKTLGRDIERIEKRLIELGVEHGLVDKRGRLALGAVDNGKGFMVSPYEVRTLWPKYQEDPATGEPYTRDQLVEALKDNGLAHLVVETTAQYDWPGYVRDRVQTWRQVAGKAGKVDDQGRYVDYDGELLSVEEARDPMADILALPRWLRALVEPVDKITLQFTRRAITTTAVPASEAAAAAATPAGA